MLKRHIGDYHFLADNETGVTMRWGRTKQENPIWAPMPELADISISNHCTKGCSFCYRNSENNHEWMSVEDYCSVLEAMNHPEYGNVFQVAIGGGEPLEHPDFLEIIDETVKRGIVPNFTTNGVHLTEEVCNNIQGKVGAVALSVVSVNEIEKEKVKMLRYYGIETNIHYVLSSENIEEATRIANGKSNQGLVGINAIIFLTYKPAGRAGDGCVIKKGEDYDEFLSAIAKKGIERPKMGFDACFVPMLLSNETVSPMLVDCCEGGFFSVYIDHKKNVSPCSFCGGKDVYSLDEYDFYDIWNNQFELFRNRQKNRCKNYSCIGFKNCRG
jgi:MoaA/NifB/PqqE/SkfB family radical SAM enzyme